MQYCIVTTLSFIEVETRSRHFLEQRYIQHGWYCRDAQDRGDGEIADCCAVTDEESTKVLQSLHVPLPTPSPKPLTSPCARVAYAHRRCLVTLSRGYPYLTKICLLLALVRRGAGVHKKGQMEGHARVGALAAKGLCSSRRRS